MIYRTDVPLAGFVRSTAKADEVFRVTRRPQFLGTVPILGGLSLVK